MKASRTFSETIRMQKNSPARHRRASVLISVCMGMLCLLSHVTACNMGQRNKQNGEDMKDDSSEAILPICQSMQYVSIQELYDFCHVPGPCRQQMTGEGRIALIKGVIDYGNVFDKQHYPQLPYEKFLMQDEKHTVSLEVWVIATDSRPIFEKIYQNQSTPEKIVSIQGTLVGFDMPMMKACHRGIRIEIHEAASLVFK